MSSIFSQFVRSLGDEAEPSDAERFEEVLKTLRGALVHALKKRALWSLSPRYLGIYGGNHWDAGDALDELLLDCYQFIFVRRLPGLIKQAKSRANIDGLIFLNIQHFLHDTQRRHDPLGFRVFEVMRLAVERLIKGGVLHVLEGERGLRNDTVLGFVPWGASGKDGPFDIRRRVEDWCDQLMPELALAWSKESVVAQLADLLGNLSSDGVETFQFGELLRPLKQEVRRRWGALLKSSGDPILEDGGEEMSAAVQLVLPDRRMAEQQSFRLLVSCVAESLGKLEETRKTQGYLRKLFQCLRHWAAELDEPSEVSELPDGKLPSDKRLSELLDIPRARVKSLRATLGRLVDACRGASDDGAEARGAGAARRRRLMTRSTQAAIAWRSGEGAGFRDAESTSPRPGDILHLPVAGDLPVEWVVIEVDPESTTRLLLLPVDDRPWVGSRDVDAGVSRVRCARDVRLDAEALSAGTHTGRLDASVLEQVDAKRRSLVEGNLRAPLAAWASDDDTEYSGWTARLDRARGRLRSEARPPAPPLAFRPASRSSGRFIQALAAIFATTAIGLSLWIQQLHRQVDELSAPFAIRSSATHDLRFGDSDRSSSLRLEATETHVVIYLVLSQVEEFPAYRLELLEAIQERSIWRSDPIARDREILMVLPRARIQAEDLRLRLYGRDESGGEQLLDEQTFRIELPLSENR